MWKYKAHWERGEGEPRRGTLGRAWAIPNPSELEEGGWTFEEAATGRTWCCDPGRDLTLLGEGEFTPADLGGGYRHLTGLEERRPVLEAIGRAHEPYRWAHLLLREADPLRDGPAARTPEDDPHSGRAAPVHPGAEGEILEVWGCEDTRLGPDSPLTPLYPHPEPAYGEDDPGEWVEWRDLEGPELPSEG